MRGRCGVPCEKASHIALKCARLSLMYAVLATHKKEGGAAKRVGAEENHDAKYSH